MIISTYTNERIEDVERCIKSLKNQTTKPEEIILVLDPIKEVVDFYRKRIGEYVKVVESDGFGLSNARNKGVEVASKDVVAFIDDDAWADKRWLESLLENFNDERVWVVGGKIVPIFDKDRPKWLSEELDWIIGCTYKGLPKDKTEIRNPIGANMAFRKEVFNVAGKFKTEVGRYGKRLLGSEETELCLRLKKVKPDVKIIYDPSAIVYHRVPENRIKLSYALRRAYYEGYSKAILSKEYAIKTEMKYARYLVNELFKKLFKGRLFELGGITVIILTVVFGWCLGKIKVTFNEDLLCHP